MYVFISVPKPVVTDEEHDFPKEHQHQEKANNDKNGLGRAPFQHI